MAKEKIIKIAIIGAESTGKSDLCRALAKHYNTLWVPEYAREYFNHSDIYNYTLKDLVVIAKEQITREWRMAKKATRFLFCDTTLITLKIWAELEFNQTPGYISLELDKIKYDYYFITDNDMPWVEDDLRQNKFSRDLILQKNIKEVTKLNAPFSVISGLNEERSNNAIAILDELFNRSAASQ